ncbi:hypothetical protein CMQ_5334 [Grosmannia clavigera kw1407]|uniref:Uncharacterized protein n=1 Tax=Grosmannia clavigera (strain kw1407 / UAMH 11150) TaxID=655863 RepID=F0XBK2_GROCL|nr:uncharacterized protein CMQ_5334 [Grosmannia clavigera kw1407]EFX05072.1 hypothetical protein CMQ_5334 [Grosmannia clavigera kw1407]
MSSPSTPLSTSDLESWEPNDVQKLLHTLIHRHCVFSGMHNCAAEMERTVQMLTSEQLAEMGIPEEPSGQFLVQWFTIYRELSRLKGTDTTLQEKLVQTADRIRTEGEGMPAPPPPSAMPPRPQQGQKRKAPVDEEQPPNLQQQLQEQATKAQPLRQQPPPQMQIQTQPQTQTQPEVIFVQEKKVSPPEQSLPSDQIITRPPRSTLGPQPASLHPNRHGKKSWEEILPKTEDGNWDTRKIDNDVIRSIDDYQLRLMILEQRNRQLLRDAREKDNSAPSNGRHT